MSKENPKHKKQKGKFLDRPLSEIFHLPQILRRTRKLPLKSNVAKLEQLANKGTVYHDQKAEKLAEWRRTNIIPPGKQKNIN